MFPPTLLEAGPAELLCSCGLVPEPFGETPYLELIEEYHNLAWAKKETGAAKLVLAGRSGLHEARAAVLGARMTGLPVYASVPASQEGRLPEEPPLLAALLCLQELGIAAFGIEFPRVTGEILELFTQLAPYAKVPLLARPETADRQGYESLLRAGVDHLCADSEFARSAVASTTPVARPPRQEDAPLLLCDATGVYYLEEDFTVSDEIECSLDMSDEILELEDTAVDALCFHVVSTGDAMELGRNAHMARCASCILAEGEGPLETALALYTCRALIDARSDVEEETMQALARAYGAIIR